MEIDRDLILKLEKLSRLELSEEERGKMMTDLSKMLGMVKKLDELDLKNVEPLMHMMNHVNQTRKDEVKGHMPTQEAMDNAPDSTDEFFKVPKVIQ